MIWKVRNKPTVINLLTPKQLAEFDDGVVLVDIFGRYFKKGFDKMDTDTRGGYTPYGVIMMGRDMLTVPPSKVSDIPLAPPQVEIPITPYAKTPEELCEQYRKDIEFILSHHNLWDPKKQYKMPDGRVYYGRRDTRSKG